MDSATAPRYVPAVERLLTQLAHRLLAIAIWVLAAKIALSFFNYDASTTAKLLPIAMIALNAALVCAFAAYWLCRLSHHPADPSRKLLLPTLCLIALTAAWMLASIVAAP
jgi:hypothetical protein